MKENKGKDVARDEIKEEAINQSRPLISPTVKVVPHAVRAEENSVQKSGYWEPS